jgi:hypothetical protein
MVRRIPARPAHPERIGWGCERYCAADDSRCGNGTERAQHPIETYGPEWGSSFSRLRRLRVWVRVRVRQESTPGARKRPGRVNGPEAVLPG